MPFRFRNQCLWSFKCFRIIIKKCNYKRTTHKIINVFLWALRKCTRNSSLEYPSSLGKPQKPYIKRYTTYNELKKFTNYLKTKEDFQKCFIIELFFKLELEQYQKLKLRYKWRRFHNFLWKNQKTPKRKLGIKLLKKMKFLIILD